MRLRLLNLASESTSALVAAPAVTDVKAASGGDETCISPADSKVSVPARAIRE